MIKTIVLVLWLGGLIPSVGWAEELRLSVGGMERIALVVNAPPGQERRPLVLVLHGGAGSAAMQRQRTGFDEVAQREGFMVAYPQGSEFRRGMHAWNTGHLMRRQVGTVDDVAFLDALIDRLTDQYGADPKRVYMTGGSNGGMMTMVYAAQRAERVAGIAPVIAAMFSFDVRPSRPIPILLINGVLDQEVPMEGGMSRNPLVRNAQTTPYKSLEDTLNFWLEVNRSYRDPQVRVEGSVTTRTWGASPGGAVTVSVVDAEAGHGWPGSGGPSRRGTGASRSFSAAERIWAFFRDQRP